MPRGVWNDGTIAKRSAAAKKAAASRKARAGMRAFVATGAPVMGAAERDALRGRSADKALAVAAIPALIARLRGKISGGDAQ